MKGKKTGGKQKGTPNKTTSQAKELILKALDNQLADFESVMNRLKAQNPTEWARLTVKMFDYVIPKHLDIKSGGEQLQAPVIQLLPPSKE